MSGNFFGLWFFVYIDNFSLFVLYCWGPLSPQSYPNQEEHTGCPSLFLEMRTKPDQMSNCFYETM